VEGDVAVVAWLGYDPPDNLFTAAGTRSAEAGAPLLNRFVDGVHAAHEPGDSHRVVVAHSYGAPLVGLAASQGHLNVNDIIVAGAPGMQVPNAAGLNIDPARVWAGMAADDPILLGSGMVHNTDPHLDSFGANRFRVDTHGHSDYWRPNSESLRNQALILIGEYNRVTREVAPR
jgi:hypothetical protein